jgi:PBP1b-binding outer membrane lipoprotein LpoB
MFSFSNKLYHEYNNYLLLEKWYNILVNERSIMSKLFRGIFVIIFLSLVFVTGCETGKEDTHYKPSEYKHNIALDKASVSMSDIDKEIISMGAETSADVVYNTYNDSIATLKEHITTLQNTQKLLSEDKDLTNSELKSWNARYNDSIKALNNKITSIEKQKENFLK